MFENPRRGRQARNFTTNVPKILDLKSSNTKQKAIQSKNGKFPSNYKVSPIDFETQISPSEYKPLKKDL